MRVTEITLASRSPLLFEGKEIGTLECCRSREGDSSLRLRFDERTLLELPAVDHSERLDYPRVFVIAGKPSDTLVLFGGEQVYWLSTEGKLRKIFKTFRSSDTEEYWETQIIERSRDVVIVYEAGILVIDENLAITCHKQKLFNDFFVSIEGDSIKFLRDQETEWQMQLADDK
jgi:hypothetical protein